MESVALASRRSSHPLCYQHRRDAGATGFSFAEVMFAVVILGIGFIMIAAIFPVAIQQSQVTNNENLAAATARESSNTLTALPTTVSNQIYLNAVSQGPIAFAALPPNTPSTVPLLPPTVKNYVLATGGTPPPAIVASFTGPRWDAIKTSLILPSDSRYAFVPFYKRENNSTVAQIIVVAVTVQNRSTYDPVVDTTSNSTSASIITARGVFPGTPANTTICPDSLSVAGGAEGWYATLSSALIANQPAGRTYRLGRFVTTTAGKNTYEIEPGDPLTEAANNDSLWGTSDDIFDAPNTYTANVYQTATLQPTVAYATIYYPPGGASIAGRITIAADAQHAQGAIASNIPPACAASGAFVIIADDWPYDPTNPTSASYVIPPNSLLANPPGIVGSLNGHIFRLGDAISTDATTPPGTYDLDPNYGMRSPLPNSPDQIPNPNLTNPTGTSRPWARVFIIGSGRTTPNSTTDFSYSGAAQDTAVYTTLVPVK